jgi:hypothetical protein
VGRPIGQVRSGGVEQSSVNTEPGENHMSKRARKRRSRKGNAANHGRKPNA